MILGPKFYLYTRHAYIYIYIYIYTHTNTNKHIYGVSKKGNAFFFSIHIYSPLHLGTKSIFKRSLTGLNSEFSFSYTKFLTKAEEPSLPYYLPIAGGRIIGFIPFPRVLVLCEMQSVSSRIWTRVAVSISYDDNHFTTGTFFLLYKFWHSNMYPLSK